MESSCMVALFMGEDEGASAVGVVVAWRSWAWAWAWACARAGTFSVGSGLPGICHRGPKRAKSAKSASSGTRRTESTAEQSQNRGEQSGEAKPQVDVAAEVDAWHLIQKFPPLIAFTVQAIVVITVQRMAASRVSAARPFNPSRPRPRGRWPMADVPLWTILAPVSVRPVHGGGQDGQDR